MKCLNLMFWPLLWSLVILSALNGFVHWDLPPELQLPSFVFTTIGGFPSLYGYQRRLGNDADGWKQWLENLTETANGRFSQVNLALTHRKAPICSLTKSSADTCHTHTLASCESAEDQRCAAAWFADDRHVQCARDDGTPLDCQTNGYNVHSVHSSPGYLLLILRAAPADPVATTNYVAKSSDCGIYVSKNDTTSHLTIPIPEINPKSSNQEVLLRSNTQTTIFYEIDEFNENFTLLWTYLEAHLNTTQICDCDGCVDIDIKAAQGSPFALNTTIHGLLVEHLTVDQTPTINPTALWDDGDDEGKRGNVGHLAFEMRNQHVDTKTPLFWRRPGRFDCPSEVTCPLELFYIAWLQEDLQFVEYVLELGFLVLMIGYVGSRKTFF